MAIEIRVLHLQYLKKKVAHLSPATVKIKSYGGSPLKVYLWVMLSMDEDILDKKLRLPLFFVTFRGSCCELRQSDGDRSQETLKRKFYFSGVLYNPR